MDIPKEKLEHRLKHLEEELRTSEEIAAKFGSGQMILYDNGVAVPAEDMSKMYRHYAKHFQELIDMYREQLAK